MIPSPQLLGEIHALKCELATETLHKSGQVRLRVTGWSMFPAVWPGDTLVVERTRTEHISEGDIVLFGRERRLFAHRVKAVKAKTGPGGDVKIMTRGDAMSAQDPPVSENDLLGKVSIILRNGTCIEPSRNLRLSERAVAAVFQRSEMAARVVVGVHGMRQNLQGPRTQHP